MSGALAPQKTETPTPAKEFHLGYSRIALFQECPAKYKFAYIDKLKRGSPVFMRRGTAYHNTLEAIRRKRIDDPERVFTLRTVEKLARYFGEQEALPPGTVDDVINAASFWFITAFPNEHAIAVEEPFSIIRGGIVLTGRIDMWERSGWMNDEKFSYDLWADDRAKHGFQAMIYQWAALDVLEAKYGVAYEGFKYNIIRVYPSVKMQEIKLRKFSQARSDWAEAQVSEIAGQIKSGYFPARPSAENCKNCPFKKACGASPYRIKIVTFGDNDLEDEEE